MRANRASKKQHAAASWCSPRSSLSSALSSRLPDWGLGRHLSNAASVAVTRPETTLGWITRSIVGIAAGIIVVSQVATYGKAPAMRLTRSMGAAAAAAGAAARERLPDVTLPPSIRGYAASTAAATTTAVASQQRN